MIEAMKQALEALGEKFTSGNSIEVERASITRDEYLALRQAIEQAEKQEPVKCTCGYGIGHPLVSKCTCTPRKEWVGLTTEEAAICWTNSEVQSWKNIEAKLKEKNYD
jgi:hypothetical protein